MTAVLFSSMLALTAAMLVSGWVLFHLRTSQQQMVARLENVGRRMAGEAPAAAPAAPVEETKLAPDFALPNLTGGTVTLGDLKAAGKRILLNFTDPKCGPCYEVLADIGGWERVYGDRLTIATVTTGDVKQNQALIQEYGLRTLLLQEGYQVAEAYKETMLPAAVLIEPDGTIVESTRGAHRVRQLVASALGLAVPEKEAPSVQAEALKPGEAVGNLRRPDLDGNMIALGERSPRPTLLLFWSPGCSHCQDLLPDLQRWDQVPNGPRLIVATSGPVGLNKELGLRAPMIQDDEGVLKRAFGATGTPAAVVIDGEGRLVADPARGATNVRGLGSYLLDRTTVVA